MLTNTRVTMSKGFASTQVRISHNHALTAPTSNSAQEEWQRCSSRAFVSVFDATCTWALRSRTPASSCTVVLKNWLPKVEKQVLESRRKGLSCAPRWVIWSYGLEQSLGELLHARSAADIELTSSIRRRKRKAWQERGDVASDKGACLMRCCDAERIEGVERFTQRSYQRYETL
jgi:hypothetical protein